MKETFSRREVLGMGALAGTALVGIGFKAITAAEKADAAKPGFPFPWEYKTLNVEETRKRAYENHFKGGCMYGVFEAVAAGAAEKLGKPYIDFPFQLSTYGGGGVASWGSLCGACNGAAMAIAMFHEGKLRGALTNEIFAWYESTALPLFVPAEPKKVKNDFEMKTSKADSTLCHISITRWTNISGFRTFSDQRVERCARIVADVAAYTVDVLNQAALNKFNPKMQIGTTADGCLKCHAKGKQAPNEPEVVSKMSCTTCHEPHD